MNKTVFVDTSFEIALAAPRDQNHERAIRLSSQAKNENWILLTTRVVLFEIGNALGKRPYRQVALQLLDAIATDPSRRIVEMTLPLYQSALELFRQRPDKDWGLVDCVSFVVMNELDMTDALTADEHFEQAGFRALLRTTT